jgi:hypothetical protein
MLDQVDGPFKSASTYMNLLNNNIPTTYIKDMETSIRKIDADVLLDTAQKYFDRDDLYEVVIK